MAQIVLNTIVGLDSLATQPNISDRIRSVKLCPIHNIRAMMPIYRPIPYLVCDDALTVHILLCISMYHITVLTSQYSARKSS